MTINRCPTPPIAERPRASKRSRLLKRPTRYLAVAAVALLAALISVAIWQAQGGGPRASVLVGPFGSTAPAFSLPNLSEPSHDLTLAQFRGKPLVVNFWASWCVPCRTEMPLLETAYRSEKGKIIFLGIDTNDTPSAAVSFLARLHVTYPAASDATATVANEYGVFGLPTTVFISARGRIMGRHVGQLTVPTLRAALTQAFGPGT